MSLDSGLAQRLLAKGLAYGACARLVSPSSGEVVPPESVDWLGRSLGYLGLEEGREHLRAFLQDVQGDPEGYRAEYVRVFERGTVPPYEASQQGSGPQPLGGPNVQLIADVAGFYRAFGLEARGERPDHLGAELEFLAFLCLKEAHALTAEQPEHARVCAEARAAFLRDHLLIWLPSFEEKVEHLTSNAALRHLVGLLGRLVQADATQELASKPSAP